MPILLRGSHSNEPPAVPVAQLDSDIRPLGEGTLLLSIIKDWMAESWLAMIQLLELPSRVTEDEKPKCFLDELQLNWTPATS